jgi:putative transposase
MTVRPAMLRLGDDVELRGVIYRLTALDGDVAMLAVAGEAPVAIKVGSLLADETFRIVGTRPTRRRITGPSMLFDSLPADVQEKARWMEDHMTEVLDGVPCNADPGQTAKGPSTSHAHRCGNVSKPNWRSFMSWAKP